jgi:hypothetical protein
MITHTLSFVFVLEVCGFSCANNVRKWAEKAFVSSTKSFPCLDLAAQKHADTFAFLNFPQYMFSGMVSPVNVPSVKANVRAENSGAVS